MVEGAERRTDERVEARLCVRFTDPIMLADAVETYSANVGLGGLCIQVARAYQPGDVVQLTIEAGGEKLPMQAVVAWCRPGYIGIRFEPAGAEHKRTLDYMAQLMAERRRSARDLGPPVAETNKPFAE